MSPKEKQQIIEATLNALRMNEYDEEYHCKEIVLEAFDIMFEKEYLDDKEMLEDAKRYRKLTFLQKVSALAMFIGYQMGQEEHDDNVNEDFGHSNDDWWKKL